MNLYKGILITLIVITILIIVLTYTNQKKKIIIKKIIKLVNNEYGHFQT